MTIVSLLKAIKDAREGRQPDKDEPVEFSCFCTDNGLRSKMVWNARFKCYECSGCGRMDV